MVTTITKFGRCFVPFAIIDGITTRKLIDFVTFAVAVANGVKKFFVMRSNHFMTINVNRKVGTYKEKSKLDSRFSEVYNRILAVFPSSFESRLRQHLGCCFVTIVTITSSNNDV